MKKKVALLLLAICMITQSFLGFSRGTVLRPVFDPAGNELPRNLRTLQQIKEKRHLNLKGLLVLRASGSGQFSEKTYKEMLHHLPVMPQQLLVLDLRQESHGFINGTPVSWTDGNYNYGNLNKTRPEIESDEHQRLRLAAQSKCIVVNPLEEASKLSVQKVMTERDLVEGLGSLYIRLPVTDHNRPTNDVIDQFVEIAKQLSSDQWLHFHCRAGKGRTTTFLTLYDIIKNAHQVSLNDIIERQKWIGGSDLNEFQKKVGEKKRAAEERCEFIKRFYTYCQEVPDFQTKWSDWLEKQQKTIAKTAADISTNLKIDEKNRSL